MRYVVSRLGFFLFSVWAAITVNFVLPRLMPGNPAETMIARFQGRLDPRVLHALELQFGLSHQPLWVQYLGYLGNLLHGQLGLSLTYYPVPVSTVIANSLPWTLGLAGVATLISVAVGTLLGIYTAWHRDSALGALLPTLTTFTQAIPYFWLALFVLYVFGFLLGWFPLAHAYATSDAPSFR